MIVPIIQRLGRRPGAGGASSSGKQGISRFLSKWRNCFRPCLFC